MASGVFSTAESDGKVRDLVLAVTFEEYRALRAEVVSALDRQYSLTNWSVSSIAVLLAATAGAWEHLRAFPNVVVTLVAFGLPMIGTIYAFAWANVIGKIATIGWYLHHIEDKVTQLFTPDEIKTAFHRTSAPGDPYWYLFGWEHTLWLSTTQKYIERVTMAVSSLLAVGYAGVVAATTAILSHLCRLTTVEALTRPITVVSGSLWLAVWIWLVYHLKVRTRMQEQRGARAVAADSAV